MNGLQSITQWQNYFSNPSGETLGVVNAAQSIGSVVSLPVVGFLSDKIGRRWTLLSGAVTIVIASAIQAASVQYGMFVFSRYALQEHSGAWLTLFRVLVGIGSMLVVQPSPMLITELAYPTHRGKYTRYYIFPSYQSRSSGLMDSAFWTMYYLGAIVASWTSYGTQKHLHDDWTWRIPSIVQAGFPIIQIALFWFLPESPRYVHYTT